MLEVSGWAFGEQRRCALQGGVASLAFSLAFNAEARLQTIPEPAGGPSILRASRRYHLVAEFWRRVCNLLGATVF